LQSYNGRIPTNLCGSFVLRTCAARISHHSAIRRSTRGDLFVEVAPGAYVSRGRNDDWIKSSTALRCDTKAIEDNVRATCGDLVAECIVVGNGRPSPVVFVEALVAMDAEKLRREIVRRTRQFHARRYVHERITSARMVVVVGRGTLPRTATKGNIRRRVVEDMFKVQLDAIFAS
ncbi:hypothetical protein POSPLADRAFT_1162708, partial [Postia placenta MAD-698-R-SB12]